MPLDKLIVVPVESGMLVEMAEACVAEVPERVPVLVGTMTPPVLSVLRSVGLTDPAVVLSGAEVPV